MSRVLLINPNKWGRGITHIWIPTHASILKKAGHEVKLFDCSCFDGIYVTGGIDENYLNSLEAKRSDGIKNKDLSKATSQLDFSFTLAENEEEEERA